MASPVSHALVAVAAGMVFPKPRPRARYWLAAALAILPDIDVLGYFNGVEYESMFGHRGFTHSLVFAALVAGILVLVPGVIRPSWGSKGINWLCIFVAVASHGVLDAMTDGGLGIAFFSPFSNARCFLPWQPIVVGPINLAEAFSPWGRAVALSELKWVIGPCLVFIVVVQWVRRRSARNVMIYVHLLDEDVEVWRPVEATPLGANAYKITSDSSAREFETERWEFPTGSIVRCAPRKLEGKAERLVATELVKSP